MLGQHLSLKLGEEEGRGLHLMMAVVVHVHSDYYGITLGFHLLYLSLQLGLTFE